MGEWVCRSLDASRDVRVRVMHVVYWDSELTLFRLAGSPVQSRQ